MKEKDLDKALGIIKKEMKKIASDDYKEVDMYNTLEWVLSEIGRASCRERV